MFIEPLHEDICDIVDEVTHVFEKSWDTNARQLSNLLRNSHVKALLETHDAIAESRKAPPRPIPFLSTIMPSDERTETVRVVGLRRLENEPLVNLFLITFDTINYGY